MIKIFRRYTDRSDQKDERSNKGSKRQIQGDRKVSKFFGAKENNVPEKRVRYIVKIG